jgi:tRNA U34 5-carboxymethylaminomethyl modifying GTPase MnmE/TrmE
MPRVAKPSKRVKRTTCHSTTARASLSIKAWPSFPGPNSYAGEDVLELQAHGGPVVLQLLVSRCLEAAQQINPATGLAFLPDLRLAAPGEFTQRAFLNDKIDLAQAEAIADLIDASTGAAARSASRSLAGDFSEEIHALRDGLVHLRMLVEATLDFPEEEIDFLQKADAQGQLERLQAQLAKVLARTQQGALLREGIKVVIAGQPNAGKSSLLNALAGAELAIVTPIAGTTRDVVQQTIQIEGVLFTSLTPPVCVKARASMKLKKLAFNVPGNKLRPPMRFCSYTTSHGNISATYVQSDERDSAGFDIQNS